MAQRFGRNRRRAAREAVARAEQQASTAQKEADEYRLKYNQACRANRNEHARGMQDGLSLAKGPNFDGYVREAAFKLVQGWDPALREALEKVYPYLQTAIRREPFRPQLGLYEMHADVTTRVLEFSLPEVVLRRVVMMGTRKQDWELS